MSGPVTIEMPFPPSVNGLFATHYRGKAPGRRRISVAYLKWRVEAEMEIMAAGPRRKIEDPVAVKITLHPASRRRADADNFSKAILDCAVRMNILPDDNSDHVKEVTVRWGEQRRPGRAVVTITPLS